MIYEIPVNKKIITEHFTNGFKRNAKVPEAGLPEGCEFIGVRGTESGQSLIFSFFKNDGKPEVKTLTPIITTRRED